MSGRELRKRGHIFENARAALVHRLDSVLLQDHEAEAIAFRNARTLFKSQSLRPERQTGLDLVDNNHGCELANNVLCHGNFLLTRRLPAQITAVFEEWNLSR